MTVGRWTLLAVFASTAFAADFAAEGRRWWSHVEALAADGMEGRNTGSPGYQRAAAYVAGEFERAGLKPAGVKAYSQPMTFNVRQIDESHSSINLFRDGDIIVPVKLGEDANISVRSDLAPSVTAGLVFAGHALVIPEADYDDLAGLDLRGKIVVFLSGGPPGIPGPLKSHYSSGPERWKALQKAGAIGTVAIANPKSMDIPWERQSLARLAPSMSLADPSMEEAHGSQVAISWNPARADTLLAGGGHTFEEILALAASGKPLPKFAIPQQLIFRSSLKRSTVESQNVVGLYEGSDPKLKHEYIVLSAHLDHLGIGEPVNGDKIYNGAMDDASGVASLIEIARLLSEGKMKLRRSVIFLAVTGEEKGLQGSRYFAGHPTVKASQIVADINMDMFLPLFPLRYLEVQGAAESTLGEQVAAACARAGVELQQDKEPDRNLFIRSDQYSFIRNGVPALAFKFGYVKGSPEEAVFKDWYKNRYHAPSDDLNQPVDQAAAAQFNRILLDLLQHVADDKQRPRWLESSFFRRFAHP